jgi:hypothetical protein
MGIRFKLYFWSVSILSDSEAVMVMLKISDLNGVIM